MYTIDRIIKKNTLFYQEHSDTDHSDMDSHCDDFYAFDWGDGYTVYIYKYRVEMRIIVSLTKEFVLEDGGDDMTIGWIHPITPMNSNLHSLPGRFLNVFRILPNTERTSSLVFSLVTVIFQNAPEK